MLSVSISPTQEVRRDEERFERNALIGERLCRAFAAVDDRNDEADVCSFLAARLYGDEGGRPARGDILDDDSLFPRTVPPAFKPSISFLAPCSFAFLRTKNPETGVPAV